MINIGGGLLHVDGVASLRPRPWPIRLVLFPPQRTPGSCITFWRLDAILDRDVEEGRDVRDIHSPLIVIVNRVWVRAVWRLSNISRSAQIDTERMHTRGEIERTRMKQRYLIKEERIQRTGHSLSSGCARLACYR